MATPQIHIHNITDSDGPDTVSQALSLLRPHLPVALPLYRRLQFGRFFDATTLLTNLADLSSNPDAAAATPTTSPWLLAFVDRSCRPETEVWLFASWETTSPAPSYTSTAATTPAARRELEIHQDALIRALARAIAALPLPTSIHADAVPSLPATTTTTTTINSGEPNGTVSNDEEADTAGITRTSYGGHAADPNVILCGAVHRSSVAVLSRSGLVTSRFKVGLVDNHTYVFDVDHLSASSRSLPAGEQKPLPATTTTTTTTIPSAEGLRWGKLTAPEHFARVRARTQIPRLERTLAVLPNVAAFDIATGEPVAWAFVGLDASLTSLHVEPGWRGKGIAKAVTRRLFGGKEEMGRFWEEGQPRLAHGYVQVGNEASCRVCDSLGGKSEWETVWVRLDLGMLGS